MDDTTSDNGRLRRPPVVRTIAHPQRGATACARRGTSAGKKWAQTGMPYSEGDGEGMALPALKPSPVIQTTYALSQCSLSFVAASALCDNLV